MELMEVWMSHKLKYPGGGGKAYHLKFQINWMISAISLLQRRWKRKGKAPVYPDTCTIDQIGDGDSSRETWWR